MRRCQRLPVKLRTPLMPSDSIASISRRVPVPDARKLRNSVGNRAAAGVSVLRTLRRTDDSVLRLGHFGEAFIRRPDDAGELRGDDAGQGHDVGLRPVVADLGGHDAHAAAR